MPVCASKCVRTRDYTVFFLQNRFQRFLLHCKFEPVTKVTTCALLHFNKNEALKLQAICYNINIRCNLTTIPVVVGVQTESVPLKLNTCSLYHENLLLQKFNDMITQALKYFSSASDIMEAVRGHFRFLWYEYKVP